MQQSQDTATDSKKHLYAMTLGALGVVFGDIGTSPLYALKEVFKGSHPIAASPENVLGILSIIFWILVFTVAVKYLTFVMRADNRGEGGTLALLSIISRSGDSIIGRRVVLISFGLFGTSLLYGEGMITPAISVLSAVEGIEVATPALKRFVVPITIAILVPLFLVQRRGTGQMGAFFGPITLLWFASIAFTGTVSIIGHPQVLSAVNPLYGIEFFIKNGLSSLLVLGAVVLVITGVEALYADMGHFGIKPIRLGWYSVVFPALLLNYFGQGALLISNPDVNNPFYEMVPSWGLYPMVVIASMATVVASQALISGSFSLTRQAVQLGYLPRVTIGHTSEKTAGQIYIHEVNTFLMIACIGLVLGFRESTNLASAYGMAVVGTMMITTTLFYFVAREKWKWSPLLAGLLVALFLLIEIPFFGANLVKFIHGGWFPVVVAVSVYTLMMTWKIGRRQLTENLKSKTFPLELFLSDIALSKPIRVSGTSVFLTGNPEGIPTILLHHLKHNKVLHERVILLSILTEDIPRVPENERVNVTELGEGLYRIVAHYGFMETPNISELFRSGKAGELNVKFAVTTFYLGRETLIASGKTRMARWRIKLFSFMSRNALDATAFFGIPPGRVVELGMQVEL